MEIINNLLSVPSFKYLNLTSYLIYFMLLLHLPYIGMVLGSSILSVAYSKWKPNMAKNLIKLAMGRPCIWIGIGMLPVVSLAFLYKMHLFNTSINIHFYFLRLAGLLGVGFLLLTYFQLCHNWCEKKEQSMKFFPFFIGILGVIILLFYCFHFINLMSLLIFPEKWIYLKLPLPFPLFAITPIIQFGGFFCLSLIITGTAILFLYYSWPEKRLPENTLHFSLLRYHGIGLLMAGALLMPLLLLWDLYTLPGYSLSIGSFIISSIIFIVIFFLLAIAAFMIKNHTHLHPRLSVFSFILALILFALVIGKNRSLQANSNFETYGVLQAEVKNTRKEIVNQREELYAQATVIDEKAGEKIYQEICTACHSFEKKVLGPPLNDVLKKYTQQQDELIAFLKNPKKIDPQYPAMPNPGLSTIKIKSVVKYLFIQMELESPKKNQNQPPLQSKEKGE